MAYVETAYVFIRIGLNFISKRSIFIGNSVNYIGAELDYSVYKVIYF